MDIDLDFANREELLKLIEHTPAVIIDEDGSIRKHNTGIYGTHIPSNPITGYSNIDHKIAATRGYFKIDILNVHIYDGIKSPSHLETLTRTEPIWELLEEEEFTNTLFQLAEHGYILRLMKPRCLDQLAAILAMIRPAKRYLIGKAWTTVMNEIWVTPTDDLYYWKKSHAYAYALAVIVQMNLKVEQLTQMDDELE